MSAPDTTVYQFNFKVGNDLHNIYTTNGGEAKELLDFFQEELIAKIVGIQVAIAAAQNVANAGAAAPRQPVTVTDSPAPAAPAAAPEGTHLCEHGEPMKFIPPGVSKASGKPFKGFWACARDRDSQCNKKIWT